MEALFTSTQSLLMVIFLVMVATFLLQRVRGIKTTEPVLIVLLLDVILANLKVVPISHELRGMANNYFAPMSINLYLLSFDTKKLRILLTRDSLLAFTSVLASICLVAVMGSLSFAHQVGEDWRIIGMFVGTCTSGSSQPTAIGTGLEVAGDTLASANATNYVIDMSSLIFLFTALALVKALK